MSKTKTEPKTPYIFRRLDNDKLIRRWLTFAQWMNLDVLRRITLRGGVEAVLVGEEKSLGKFKSGKRPKPRGVAKWPMISRSMGVSPDMAAKYNQQAQEAGLTGVFYDQRGRVHISDEGQRMKLLDVRFPNQPIVDRDGIRSRKNF